MQVFPHLALFHRLVGRFTFTSDLHPLLTHMCDTQLPPPAAPRCLRTMETVAVITTHLENNPVTHQRR